MPRVVAPCFALLAFGSSFWLLVCLLAGTREPWDAEAYWTIAYPSSGLLAGIIGFRFDSRGWLAGLVLTLSQFPVMLMLAGLGPMSAFGLVLLGALAVPTMIASTAGSWLGRRSRRR
ncbi:hypothetical protein FA743_11850 [Paracoccus gahaiensis]|uniref:Uncharacterized protein n=1 Tax=Paracoccus gahaiensis TaxID=1706839 RepID=A0A4U0R8S2_9RHOB|nr:hypothetical protein [Paracoccus gahaiensis]TJZ91216.1 hypothetical protein FA743_11850 [Paracoccus gahaiensis]